MKELTSKEQKTLENLEAVIEKGLPAFIQVGRALQRIRGEKLYRADYMTFQDYCDQRWGMTIRHAERLMIASKIVDEMRPIGRVPTSESQFRPLTGLKHPKERKEAWEKAIKMAPGGRPTAKHVEEAVKEVRGTRVLKPGRKREKSDKPFEVKESFEFSANMAGQIYDYVSEWVEKYGEDIMSIHLIAKIGRKED